MLLIANFFIEWSISFNKYVPKPLWQYANRIIYSYKTTLGKRDSDVDASLRL